MKSQPAYSLIFAFIVITVMLLVAAATIENTNDKISYYKDLEGGSLAYLAAQSAAELGILDMKHFNPGYEMIGGAAFQEDADGDGTAETHGDYTIYSKAKENDNDGTAGTYYLPMPGTGSAGNPDDCSILNDDEPVDHSCNWNKLLYGQTVTIPLYSDDGLGGIDLPTDLGFSSWHLMMRTPCIDPNDDTETCSSSGRYQFNTSGSSTGEGDSIVFWQLTATDSTDAPISLIPDDGTARNSSFVYDRNSSNYNNEIYEKLLNQHSTSDFTVLSALSTDSNYKPLYDFCNRSDINKPELVLYVASPMLDTSDDPIPYLEWQLSIDIPIADTKSIVVGEGYHQGVKHIFYYPYIINRSTTGENTNVYTLSN